MQAQIRLEEIYQSEAVECMVTLFLQEKNLISNFKIDSEGTVTAILGSLYSKRSHVLNHATEICGPQKKLHMNKRVI